MSAFSHDPIKYRGGMNLYEYCNDDPTSRTDPRGLKDVTTNVKECKGYIKGDWVWGWISSHDFIAVGGTGYGRYSKDGSCFGSSVIKSDDLNVYPEKDPSTVAKGQPYSVCTPVVLDDQYYDVGTFESCVQSTIAAQAQNPGSYSCGWRDCTDFMITVISDCRMKARKCPYPSTPGWGMCFLPGTLVDTSDGFVAIEKIKPGTQVWSFDHKVKAWELNRVTHVHEHEHDGSVVEIVADQFNVKVTGKHCFWVASGDNLDDRAAFRGSRERLLQRGWRIQGWRTLGQGRVSESGRCLARPQWL